MRTEVDMMDLVLDLVNLNSNINFWLLLMRRLLNVNLVDGLNQTIVELAIMNENISDHINLLFYAFLYNET